MSREKKYTQPRFYFGAHSQLGYFKEILHTQKCINNDNIKVCRYIDFNVKRSSNIVLLWLPAQGEHDFAPRDQFII